MLPEVVYNWIVLAETLTAKSKEHTDAGDFEGAHQLLDFALKTMDKARDESAKLGINYGRVQ